ncbi:hypothetical protein [Kineococcus indalonis]|uniref:hypothetical protein n=1 Tax=Kineococcus indalonis TaxID=2696566 RepID=UPI001411D68F|nr:hypothetical protein [Kineococcus indalonis]NAZ85196.1 hypothetical protein [Kineococcus indalonis]
MVDVMHEASFNRDATAKGSKMRAPTTGVGRRRFAERSDRPVRRRGRLLATAQAKLMGRATTTARSMTSDRCEGMQHLIAGDQFAAVQDLLNRRLTANAKGIGCADHADARAQATEVVHTGDVRSRLVSTKKAHEAAGDPTRWGNRQAAAAASRKVGAALTIGATTKDAFTDLLKAVGQAARVRAGETSATAVSTSTFKADASNVVRPGSIISLSKSIGIALAV